MLLPHTSDFQIVAGNSCHAGLLPHQDSPQVASFLLLCPGSCIKMLQLKEKQNHREWPVWALQQSFGQSLLTESQQQVSCRWLCMCNETPHAFWRCYDNLLCVEKAMDDPVKILCPKDVCSSVLKEAMIKASNSYHNPQNTNSSSKWHRADEGP